MLCEDFHGNNTVVLLGKREKTNIWVWLQLPHVDWYLIPHNHSPPIHTHPSHDGLFLRAHKCSITARPSGSLRALKGKSANSTRSVPLPRAPEGPAAITRRGVCARERPPCPPTGPCPGRSGTASGARCGSAAAPRRRVPAPGGPTGKLRAARGARRPSSLWRNKPWAWLFTITSPARSVVCTARRSDGAGSCTGP